LPIAAACVASGDLASSRRRAPDHQPRRVELGRHVGELELRRLEVGQRLAELLALDDVARRRLQAGARAAQRAGADVDAPAVEPHHRDLEAVTLGPEPVGDRHLAVLEDHRRGRLAVPAELLLLLAERQARRAASTTSVEMPPAPGPPVRSMTT
jgi:hypothetical protein